MRRAPFRRYTFPLLPVALRTHLTKRQEGEKTKKERRNSAEREKMMKAAVNNNVGHLLNNVLEPTEENKQVYFEGFARVVAPSIPFAFVGFDQVGPRATQRPRRLSRNRSSKLLTPPRLAPASSPCPELWPRQPDVTTTRSSSLFT